MVECPSCFAKNDEKNTFCSECGGALNQELGATITHGQLKEQIRARTSLSESSHHGRFLPGTKIADRYRIVSLVGKGGMGEVYRADDLKLGQTVALKFLPKDFADDPSRQEYFHSEVRLTRQISHPNVCRVYDIGEIDGQQFLSMEYIDGEDLRVLLRRIGRLPHDKGVQIAQQLCAGLAAAHAQGVLHRDLKPANIMIDGRGHVRITDFGLAMLAEEQREGELAGTPAYMAPEQLTRGQATIQSDLFALGLILAEVFTGKRVQGASSIPELIQAHKESSLSQTLNFSDDIDPAVRQVFLRCLEKKPGERPISARAVAAALPGGDPLAAALAAGETPSPEIVAAAGETGQLPMRTAGIFLVLVLVGLAGIVPLAGNASATLGLNKEPAAYAQQARDVLEELGLYDPRTEDSAVSRTYEAYGFAVAGGRPKRMEFWYRLSPEPLVPDVSSLQLAEPMVVTLRNPAPVPGMVSVRLDRNGTLRELLVVPSQPPNEQTSVTESALFEMAGLERDAFTEIESADWTPPIYADNVTSFAPVQESNLSGVRRVNVAELSGQVQYFHVVEDAGSRPRTFGSRSLDQSAIGGAISVLMTLIFMILAWINLRTGRSDLRGAKWVALFMFVIELGDSLLESTLTPGAIMSSIYLAFAQAARFWLCYVALEPLARRYWPEMMIAWSRAVAGRFLDPGIGRDILLGTLIGLVFSSFTLGVLGRTLTPVPTTLSGTRFLISILMGSLGFAVQYAFFLAVAMVLIRAVMRNTWLPIILTALVFPVVYHFNVIAAMWESLPGAVPLLIGIYVYYGIVVLLIARLGLIAAATFMLCHDFIRHFPWSNDLIGPDVAGCVFAVVMIATIALYGFYTSVGGHTAFQGE